MALRAYYDGSGQLDDPACKFVTLAGYAASPDIWTEIESKWDGILRSRVDPYCPQSKTGRPYFHCREAMHQQKGYSRALGWTNEAVAQLLRDLANALGSCQRDALIGFCCTIEIQGYNRFKRINPTHKTYIEICLDHCLGQTFVHKAAQSTEIFFDRNEVFEPVLRQYWEAGPNGNRAWWAEQVIHLGAVNDMRDVYGIQAADVLAWIANRHYANGPDDPWGCCLPILSFMRPTLDRFLDFDGLNVLFDADGEYKK